MFEVSNLETLIALVVRGLGVALAPRNNVAESRLALSVVNLPELALHLRTMVVYAAGSDGAAT
jgi:DNA-binding transcriptional LysR family regulator